MNVKEDLQKVLCQVLMNSLPTLRQTLRKAKQVLGHTLRVANELPETANEAEDSEQGAQCRSAVKARMQDSLTGT